ncbi:MAG: hypothetical protein Q4G23_02380 [Clostridia bacterium]|nr:hypothetical protein [Clostridia bacterium]
MSYTDFLIEHIALIAGIIIILPIIIVLIMTFVKLSQMKTANPDDYAANYIDAGSFRLTESRDVFLYSNLSKTPRPKPQNKN